MVKTTTLQLKRNLKYNLKQQELSLVSEVDLRGEMGGGEGLTQLILPTTTPPPHNPIGLLKFLIKDCDHLDHRLLPVINILYRLCKK